MGTVGSEFPLGARKRKKNYLIFIFSITTWGGGAGQGRKTIYGKTFNIEAFCCSGSTLFIRYKIKIIFLQACRDKINGVQEEGVSNIILRNRLLVIPF